MNRRKGGDSIKKNVVIVTKVSTVCQSMLKISLLWRMWLQREQCHKNWRVTTKPQRSWNPKPNVTDKSYGIIIISDDNIEVDDDSDKNEDWTTSKEDENLLRKDSEDDFMFNCNQC